MVKAVCKQLHINPRKMIRALLVALVIGVAFVVQANAPRLVGMVFAR
jgi:hypothetical protein